MQRLSRKVVGSIGLLLVVGLIVSVVVVWLQPSRPGYAATVKATSTQVSGITVQNESDTAAANVTIDFYDQIGNKVANATIATSIPASSQQTWYSPNIPNLPDGFIGSAVVSSDQPVAAIVNTQTPSGVGTDPSNPARIGTSSGVNSPSSTAYAPQVMRNYYGWTSSVYVQNTTGATENVNVIIIDKNGNQAFNQNYSIPAYSSKSLRQADMTSLGDNFVGSAVISAGSGQVATTVNLYNAATDYTTAQLLSYNGFSGGATKLYAPRVVKNYYGYNSGFKVQNIGNAATTVTATFYIGSSQGATLQAVIQPGQAWGPYMPTTNISDGTGSAVFTSNGQPIVAIVNEDNRLVGQGITYNAFLDGSATGTVLFPQVTAKYYGYSSGVQFQNVGSSTAHITLTLTKPGQTKTLSFTLDPNKSISTFAPNSGLTDFNGAGVLASDQPIVGIANMSYRSDVDPRYGSRYGDTFTTYNGMNK